jgi:hypothetical protein
MSGSAHPLSFRRRRAWLLVLGVLAIALHLLAGSGWPRAARGDGESFVALLCTSHGLVRVGAASAADGESVPARAAHDCCKLCAAGGPLLAADIAAAVPPAPTFILRQDALAFAQPAPALWSAHAPRGPPVYA